MSTNSIAGAWLEASKSKPLSALRILLRNKKLISAAIAAAVRVENVLIANCPKIMPAPVRLGQARLGTADGKSLRTDPSFNGPCYDVRKL